MKTRFLMTTTAATAVTVTATVVTWSKDRSPFSPLVFPSSVRPSLVFSPTLHCSKCCRYRSSAFSSLTVLTPAKPNTPLTHPVCCVCCVSESVVFVLWRRAVAGVKRLPPNRLFPPIVSCCRVRAVAFRLCVVCVVCACRDPAPQPTDHNTNHDNDRLSAP